MTHELEKEFTGTSEVKGFKFTQTDKSETAYIYQVEDEGKVYYEVFKRRKSPLCVDYENRIYSETEFKENYPSSKRFGIDAFTTKDYNRALDIFDKIQSSSISV